MIHNVWAILYGICRMLHTVCSISYAKTVIHTSNISSQIKVQLIYTPLTQPLGHSTAIQHMMYCISVPHFVYHAMIYIVYRFLVISLFQTRIIDA